MATEPDNIALWAVTPRGLAMALRVMNLWPKAALFCSRRLCAPGESPLGTPFDGLSSAVADAFSRYQGHVFFMATGIVVRIIAPHLVHKTRDPAVVVVDDAGRFAISLVSGHIGGANRLAREVADILKAEAVVTTATDARGLAAVDVAAVSRGLAIENPKAIKTVNMAVLEGGAITVHDPLKWFSGALPATEALTDADAGPDPPAVWVDDTTAPAPPDALVLRPPSLVAGIGCNRNTPCRELSDLLDRVLADHHLSPKSLWRIASIDLKKDEEGLLALSREREIPLLFFTRDALNRVGPVPTPSAMVARHAGVPSVCEAAALLAARPGPLIVTKEKSRNATIAIARRVSPWWASDPAASTTSLPGPER